MKVQVLRTGSAFRHPRQVGSPHPTAYGEWSPRVVVGASSLGGLLLPDANAAAGTLYGPRGVWTDGESLIVCDTGNHRVLIWHSLPTVDGAPADVVLGQPDFGSESPSNPAAKQGLQLPTGVVVHEGRLVVADAWHHRVLVWDEVPQTSDVAADHVLLQPDAHQTAPNAGGEVTAGCAYWPFGVGVIDGRFYVTDTNNRRVLGWTDGIPTPGQPADLVLGQPDPAAREENRGGSVQADSFRWPHAVAGTGSGGLLVADAGNHRVLRWDQHPESDCPADAVLGQDDLVTGTEFPYVSQAGRLRFPYAIATQDQQIAVADTANNRVLFYDIAATGSARATLALAQPDVAANGENRWESVADDTLCWPYGLCWSGDWLAVADSGNNRVVLWHRDSQGRP